MAQALPVIYYMSVRLSVSLPRHDATSSLSKPKVVLQLKLCLWITLSGQEITDQRLLDREDSVISDMRVSAVEDLRRKRFIPRRRHNEVDVRRSHGVAVEHLQKPARGAVIGDGVGGGPEAIDAVSAIDAGNEAAPKVHVDLLVVLLLVQPVGSGVPDVQLGALDRRSGRGGEDAAGEAGVVCFWTGSGEGVHDAGVHGQDGRVGAPEGAEDCGRRGAGWSCLRFGQLVGGSLVHEGFETENVTDELSFVACWSGELSGFIDLCLCFSFFSSKMIQRDQGTRGSTKSTPAIHSDTVKFVSRAKS